MQAGSAVETTVVRDAELQCPFVSERTPGDDDRAVDPELAGSDLVEAVVEVMGGRVVEESVAEGPSPATEPEGADSYQRLLNEVSGQPGFDGDVAVLILTSLRSLQAQVRKLFAQQGESETYVLGLSEELGGVQQRLAQLAQQAAQAPAAAPRGNAFNKGNLPPGVTPLAPGQKCNAHGRGPAMGHGCCPVCWTEGRRKQAEAQYGGFKTKEGAAS